MSFFFLLCFRLVFVALNRFVGKMDILNLRACPEDADLGNKRPIEGSEIFDSAEVPKPGNVRVAKERKRKLSKEVKTLGFDELVYNERLKLDATKHKAFDVQVELYRKLLNGCNDKVVFHLFQNEVQGSATPDFYPVNLDNCESCGEDLVRGQAVDNVFDCPKCGRQNKHMDSTSSSVAYGEDVEYSSFSYKRVNHLKEWMTHLKIKQNKKLPPDAKRTHTIQQIMAQLRLQGVSGQQQITFRDVKKAMKACHMQPYYDMCISIWQEITGCPPMQWNDAFEEKILIMQRKIRLPFQKYCPAHKRHLWSYPYLMFKFCQRLGRDDLLIYFALLSSSDKLDVQEQTYAKICNDVGWTFQPMPASYRF
jgi:predicted RNA-binding Zn-ribbon protein involved in translation (DUF1610 family)